MKISAITVSIRTDGLKSVQRSLKNQTFTDFEWLCEIGLGNNHDLNSSYNRAVRRAKGEIFVSIQDYIEFPPDFLENIVKKYRDDTFYTIPVGKTKDRVNVEWDWRKNNTETGWQGWEIDAGFCPMKALYEIGGFDEELDRHWTFDNVSVGYRAAVAGYSFGVANDMDCVAFDHDAFEKHPFRHLKNDSEWNKRLEWYSLNPRLTYLDKDCTL